VRGRDLLDAGCDRADVLNDLVERDAPLMESGRDQRSDRFRKIKWVDFSEGKISVLKFVQEFGIAATS
jgi:hypothetical protein